MILMTSHNFCFNFWKQLTLFFLHFAYLGLNLSVHVLWKARLSFVHWREDIHKAGLDLVFFQELTMANHGQNGVVWWLADRSWCELDRLCAYSGQRFCSAARMREVVVLTAYHFVLTCQLRCLIETHLGRSFGKHTLHLAFKGLIYFVILGLVQRVLGHLCNRLNRLLQFFTLSKLTFWFLYFSFAILRYIRACSVP